jgi:hypothetical protein
MTFPPPMFSQQSPDVNSDGEAEAEGDLDDDEVAQDDMHGHPHHGMDERDSNHNYHLPQMGLGTPSEQPMSYSLGLSGGQGHHDEMSMEQHESYEGDDDEMLLDSHVSGIDFGSLNTPQYHESFTNDDDEGPMPDSAQDDMSTFDPHAQMHDYHSLDPQHMDDQHHPDAENVEVDDDTFEDLLGSLEDHLNDQDADPVHVGEDVNVDVPEGEDVAPVSVPGIEEVAVEAKVQAVAESDPAGLNHEHLDDDGEKAENVKEPVDGVAHQ